MPEIPTQLNTEQKTEQVQVKAANIWDNEAKMNAFFDYAKEQVAPQEEKLDLYEPDRTFDFQEDETMSVTPPTEAIAPKTRAQEIKESLFYLPPHELVGYSDRLSRSVVALRHTL